MFQQCLDDQPCLFLAIQTGYFPNDLSPSEKRDLDALLSATSVVFKFRFGEQINGLTSI